MPVLPESLGKWIVVNLELGDPLVLVGGHPQELGLGEGGGGVEVVGHHALEAEHVSPGDHVEPHVILVHGGQDKLRMDIIIWTIFNKCFVYLHG